MGALQERLAAGGNRRCPDLGKASNRSACRNGQDRCGKPCRHRPRADREWGSAPARPRPTLRPRKPSLRRLRRPKKSRSATPRSAAPSVSILRDLFGKLGLADMIAAKTAYQKSGVAAAAAVARGEADLAMTFVPELLQAEGVRILGALPPPYGHETAYAAAVASESAASGQRARLHRGATAPAARAVFAKAGFTPAGCSGRLTRATP